MVKTLAHEMKREGGFVRYGSHTRADERKGEGRVTSSFPQGKIGMNEKCGVKWQFGGASARHQAFGVAPSLLGPGEAHIL